MSFLDEEERRSRGGAPLTSARLARVARATSTAELTAMHLEGIDRSLRTASVSTRPSALRRALGLAAWIGDPSLGEAAAALVLCAEGRTDRVRLLPFDGVRGVERDDATRRWREGDEQGWEESALTSFIARARKARAALDTAVAALPREEVMVDALGRAGISARLALASLREQLVTTVPLLATDLGLSRPAVDDALLRLTELGLAIELTGRRRDRVFAYRAAIDAAE